MQKRVLWITTTAVFIALLIGAQAATASMSQFVTGSLVNLILITSVMISGPASGLTVAFLSPVLAKLVGIGPPVWILIPFIMAGNMTLVIIWYLIGKRRVADRYLMRIVALVTAAVCKFLVLYLGIVKLAVPLLANLPPKMATAVTASFSWPQLVTALIGGAVAYVILPVIEMAVTKNK
ncbi:MAG: ECF transporter S component [Clostridiales bacterium]|nr:ECF transporter S component [Clostridiales bacterium]